RRRCVPAAVCPAPPIAALHPPIAALWQPPTNLATRDLFVGEWGAERAWFQSRMTVSDSSGRRWHVKQGGEAAPEIVVSRVLAAVGYHQPPQYFLKSLLTMRGGRACCWRA